MNYYEWLGKQDDPSMPPSRADVWNAAIDEAQKTISNDVKVVPEADKPFTVIQMCLDKIERLKS